ncbi:hypothetical protein ORK51_05835 [Stenotrophomonas rhizophila]|jgi:hypothetical protein|uniref:hypothetical protein n=1 Tax=Stenotrophomonas rhizophila TaxID=216778 RepID=UPI00224B416E|nr:hypothetical protein [Stenotrophomonas rhizophila]MCX2919688.1 hypothetical protein [Stenotrophomonas rhizophila]
MLSDREQEDLVKGLMATAEVIGDQLRPTAAAYMVQDLSCYSMAVLERALAGCRRELKGRLSLAAVLERIDDGHPAPNEAWAVAIQAADERNTVVWTTLTQQAWNTALPLVQAGDKIAARPAFLETYGRLLKDARAARLPASYTPSLGFDLTSRNAALTDAVSKGLLAHDQVRDHLQLTAATPAFNPVALLAGKVEASPGANAKILARLEELARELAA